jgi:hypothetical protein
MDSAQQAQPAIEAERLPYDAEFFKRSEDFCASILASLPELSGVAIVPLWTNQPEKMPAGLLRLRNSQPPYLASLLTLLGKLASFGVDVHRDLINQLKMFDQYAANLAEQIKLQTDELNRLAETNQTTTNAAQSE